MVCPEGSSFRIFAVTSSTLLSSLGMVGCLARSLRGYCRDIRPGWQKLSHRQEFLLTQQQCKMDGASTAAWICLTQSPQPHRETPETRRCMAMGLLCETTPTIMLKMMRKRFCSMQKCEYIYSAGISVPDKDDMQRVTSWNVPINRSAVYVWVNPS